MANAERFNAVRQGLFRDDLGVYYAPIRHHSPACAWAVRALIRDIQPRQILIEAPVDLAPHIDVLLDRDTEPPVAIAVLLDSKDQPRLAAYYPFCAHSPEYVALTEGRRLGCQMAFIDLASADKVMSGRPEPDVSVPLDDEHYFDSGDFVVAMCRKLGCRDGFELWDHLFESKLGSDDWRQYFGEVGAYCAAMRDSTAAAVIVSNGDDARERHMAAAIADARKREGPIVVVVGGFHVPALLTENASTKTIPTANPATTRSYLVRYGFEALDALNGYGAGLPQPGYYDYLWKRANESTGKLRWRETALDLISRFGERLKQSGHIVSVPAQVEVIRVAECLAMMRGRLGAARYDLIDAVRSAMVKGEVGGREVWTERLLEFLRGDAIGNVPASAGSPPLVEDARLRSVALRIDVSDGARRKRRLDIRRKPNHLAASRFFHAMTMLESGFAERQSGPDFISGIHTGRLFEEWTYAWSPMVEGRLIEKSVLGDSVPRACLGLLHHQRIALQTAGKSRDIIALTDLFAQGVLAGLGSELAPFLRDLSADIQTHGDFDSVVQSLRRLHYIAQTSGPLGIPDSLDLDGVRLAAYRRLIYLCDDLPNTPKEAIQERMEALRLVVELLRDPGATVYDHGIFDDAVDRVADDKPPPEILGSVLAICVQSGRRPATELCRALAGSMNGTADHQEDRIGVVRGILFTTPEILWRNQEVLEHTDQLVCGLSDEEFLDLLPHIRLAFTALNPRESDRLAALLSSLHGGHASEFMERQSVLSDHDLNRGLNFERILRETLQTDGLETWFEADYDD